MERKSQKQKELQGTARKDRSQTSPDGFEYLDRVPSPGKHLNGVMTDRARKLYDHFGQKLVGTGRLTELDLPNLVQLAIAWDKFIWAEERMAQKNAQEMGAGYVQRFKSGATNITTEFSIAEKSQDQIIKLSKMFGLSFKDRHGMSGFFQEQDPNQTSLFEDLSNPSYNLKAVGDD